MIQPNEITSNCTCSGYLTFYDQLLTIATPWTKNKIIFNVMIKFNDTSEYIDCKYYHSNQFYQH